MASPAQAGDLNRAARRVILAPGDDSRELRTIYEDAGADRLAFSLPHIESVEDARIALEKIAANVL